MTLYILKHFIVVTRVTEAKFNRLSYLIDIDVYQLKQLEVIQNQLRYIYISVFFKYL